MPLHGFPQKFQCCLAIPTFRYAGFQNFAFVIDSAPEVLLLVFYLDENLVQVPSPLRTLAHGLGSLL